MQQDGGATPFGGVSHDVQSIEESRGDREQACKTLLCAADLPLSLIGDLVMWPYTALFTCINR